MSDSTPWWRGGPGIVAIAGLTIVVVAAFLFAGPGFFRSEDVEGREADIWMQNVAGRIDMYRLEVGRYPATLQDLVVRPEKAQRWHGPYARQSELVDLWGTPYNYTTPGTQGRPYDLISLGADRRAGGEGRNRDRVHQPR